MVKQLLSSFFIMAVYFTLEGSHRTYLVVRLSHGKLTATTLPSSLLVLMADISARGLGGELGPMSRKYGVF